MDKITLKNLAFYGYHGALPEENQLGQRFNLDIELYLDLKEVGEKDDLSYGVSYVDIFNIAQENCEKKRYKLIEALAENICKDILDFSPKIMEVVVKVRKPQAPVPGIFDYFEVEIRRKR
ncbi:MAG: dihydroneopterin aldolase [Clostridia bacterium]|jgi:dihydroneopterin aldolase|nr:dihydroneopterin aldolase [Clostridia bacterium]